MKQAKSNLFERILFVLYMSFFVFFGVLFVLFQSACSSDQPNDASSELYDFVIQKYMPSDFILNVFSLNLHDNETVDKVVNNEITLSPIGPHPSIKTIDNVKTIQFESGSSLSTSEITYSNQATFMVLVYLDEPPKHTHFISTAFETPKAYSLRTSLNNFQTHNDGLTINSNVTLVRGKWYALAATFDGPNFRTKLYINGLLVKEGVCYNYGTYSGLILNKQSESRYSLAMTQVWNSTVLSEADVFYYTILYQNIYNIKLT